MYMYGFLPLLLFCFSRGNKTRPSCIMGRINLLYHEEMYADRMNHDNY